MEQKFPITADNPLGLSPKELEQGKAAAPKKKVPEGKPTIFGLRELIDKHNAMNAEAGQ